MQFCSQCGKEIADGALFCSACGQAVAGQTPPPTAYRPVQPTNPPVFSQPVYPPQSLLQQLSLKIKTNAILWIIIACLQFVIGLFNLIVGIALNQE